MVEMHLAAIRVELPTNTPVVLLQEVGEARRTLPILIGHQEATAIAFALQGVETARPMTHDLMRDLVQTLGARVDAVVVTELVDGIFYAEIRMTVDGRPVVVSSRPSDAMALAVRVQAPIFAEDALLDAEGVVIQDDDGPEQDDVIEQFQRFIEDVRPEDFAS
jgi:bifunctional DNase/RNase